MKDETSVNIAQLQINNQYLQSNIEEEEKNHTNQIDNYKKNHVSVGHHSHPMDNVGQTLDRQSITYLSKISYESN